MRYMSVCSGIECASVAWLPLGWTPVAFSEIDPFCCALLKHHYPEVPNHGDFSALTDAQLRAAAPVDVLTAGTPCQSFSVAGLRGGMDDARGNLALEFIRLAHRLKPRWIVWENVPGVLSSNGGRDWARILHEVGECGYGYAWRVLDAQHWGVPQRRRRVFLVGHIGGEWQRAAAVLFERAGVYGHITQSRKKREAVAGTLGGGSGARGWCDDTDRATFVAEPGPLAPWLPQGYRVQNPNEPSDTVTHNPAGGTRINPVLAPAHTLRADGFDASEDGTGRGTPLVPELAPTLRSGGNATGGHRPPGTDVDTCESLIPELALNAHGGTGRSDGESETFIPVPAYSVGLGSDVLHAEELAQPITRRNGDPGVVAFSCKDAGQDVGEVSPTLRAMSHAASHANAGGQVAVAVQETESGTRESPTCGTLRSDAPGMQPCGTLLRDGWVVRRLTPTECERLQGLPDSYSAIPYRGRPATDGPRYRAIGNGWAVPVVRWIGERIAYVDSIPAE